MGGFNPAEARAIRKGPKCWFRGLAAFHAEQLVAYRCLDRTTDNAWRTTVARPDF